jgi:hypothetical protein
MSFRVPFHAAVCQCVSVMILATELYYLSMQFQSATRPLFCGSTALRLSVQDRREEVTHPVPPVFFSVLYIYIYYFESQITSFN